MAAPKVSAISIRLIIAVCLFLSSSSAVVDAQQTEGWKNDDAEVVSFAAISFPSEAAAEHASGAVVVQAKLDDQDEVTDAVAISGNPNIARYAVANIKRWRFRPNSKKTATIVYNFVFVEGQCKLINSSLFVLQPSNVVLVMGCQPREPSY